MDGARADQRPIGCDPGKPFGAPMAVEGLALDADDEAVFLTEDRLTAYIDGARSFGVGSSDIWEAHRDSPDVPFGPATLVSVNTADYERFPVLTHDGLRLFFNHGVNGMSLLVSTRSGTNVAFVGFAPVGGIEGGEGDVFRHWLSRDDRLLYFDSIRTAGPGDRDIFVADLSPASVASNLRPVRELNSAYDDGAPVLTGDELTVFFSSRRPGGVAPDSDDIWIARRVTTSAPFGDIRNVSELNTIGHDSVNWVSSDGCVVFFWRQIGGNQMVYQATRGAPGP